MSIPIMVRISQEALEWYFEELEKIVGNMIDMPDATLDERLAKQRVFYYQLGILQRKFIETFGPFGW